MTTREFQKKQPLSILFAYFKPHRGLFALDLVCATIVALIDLAFPMVTRKSMYDLLPQQQYRAFFVVMGVMMAAFIVRALLYYVIAYWGHTFGIRVEADIRRDLFIHVQELDVSFFDHNRTGQLMSRLTSDLFEITELAHHGPEDLLISTLTIIGALVIMFSIEWRLALVVACILPVFIAVIMSRRSKMGAASRNEKQKTAAINVGIESSLSGIRTARAFANEDEEIDKFTRCTDQYVSAKQGYYKVMAGFFSGTELMMNLMSLSVIFVGSYLIMKNQMDIATLVTFNMYVASVQSPIRKLTQFTEQYTQGMAGFQRFRAIMHEDPDIVDAPDAVALTHVDGDIRFNDVSFSYDEGKGDVLSHINLHIKPGEMLALVGQSGGGKSTLCQLIPRFYEISSGSITLDGQDIRHIKLADLRGSIGIVQQDVFLFAGTILDNIRYGRPNATMDEVIEAAKLAEIHEDVMAMPDGYNTVVGERGVMLSGGQKQRVSIARIFLKNPRVLILDEATSALDTATERKIQAAFDRLAKGRTTLVIAHRLSTIRSADEIVVIGEHGILERGTHAQLVEQGGVYAELAAGARLSGEG